jgi:hypothetical protein
VSTRGSNAAERIYQLRYALAKLITKHGWTTRSLGRERPPVRV